MIMKKLSISVLVSIVAVCLTWANAEQPKSAAADIAHWATLPADGPAGHPMPLTGSWNIGRWYQQPWKGWGQGGDSTRKPSVKDRKPQAWDPTYFTELIQQGHHVLPSFPDPMTRGAPEGGLTRLGVRFEPALEYCAKHKLPIAFRDWNLADNVAKHEKGLPNEESARFIVNGKQKGRKASPIGAIERWREFGRAWGGSGFTQAMAKIYPDPPLIVYLNNNEAGEIRARDIDENATRFVEKYGADLPNARKAEILHEGYRERYQALFAAAREAAPEGWVPAMRFVAYNAFPWPKLRGVTPLQIKDYDQLPSRFHEWSYFDGAMPEFYNNQWQVGRGKTDFSCWSPQAESTTYAPMARDVFKVDPDYYFGAIGWEGGIPGRRGTSANAYATGDFGGGAVKKWDFDRYQGMLQFGLWAMRPRVLREFRGGATRDAYYQKTWELYIEAVDRVWERQDLQPFWKFGKLVENPEIIWQPGNADYCQLEHWYMLHCDANPPAKTWPKIFTRGSVKLRVQAMALVLGEAPERRWMVYAHAPLGAVKNAGIKLPDYGTLDVSVSRTGSFYVVNEADKSVSAAYWGGPAELTLEPEHTFVDQRNFVRITPYLVSSKDVQFTRHAWSVNGDQVHEAESLESRTIELTEDGANTVTVTATAADGEKIVGETTVWFGPAPSDQVVYRLSLDRASHWQGPWNVTGSEYPGTLQTYRLMPNPGSATDPVLHGGTFVDDPEMGRVLEVRPGEGLWGERSSRTVNNGKGHPNKTIAFKFKAETIGGRQVLYSEGHGNAGFNIYLDGDTLYAGGWGVKKKFGDWQGNWCSTQEGIQAGRWHHVLLVLRDAADKVQPDKLHLYLDGEKVGSTPGKRLPQHHSAPRLGSVHNTRFHDGETGGTSRFKGRLADFQLINAVRSPDELPALRQ